MFLSRLLEPVKAAAREAGETLWQMYQSGEVQYSQKADDSPVTSADYAANRIIIDRLSELTPDIPIISEESSLVPLAQRQDWPRYWLIDPMDGTQEFVARSGDFAVSIADVELNGQACSSGFFIVYFRTFKPSFELLATVRKNLPEHQSKPRVKGTEDGATKNGALQIAV